MRHSPEIQTASARVPDSLQSPRNFVPESVFYRMVDEEVHKATRLQYCFSILCLSPDLPHPRESLRPLLEDLAKMAVRHLRAPDLATRLTDSSIAFLLIEAEPRDLPAIVYRLVEALELSPLGGGRPVTFSSGAASYPRTATNSGDLIRLALELMAQAQSDGGNRLYLPEQLPVRRPAATVLRFPTGA